MRAQALFSFERGFKDEFGNGEHVLECEFFHGGIFWQLFFYFVKLLEAGRE